MDRRRIDQMLWVLGFAVKFRVTFCFAILKESSMLFY